MPSSSLRTAQIEYLADSASEIVRQGLQNPHKGYTDVVEDVHKFLVDTLLAYLVDDTTDEKTHT